MTQRDGDSWVNCGVVYVQVIGSWGGLHLNLGGLYIYTGGWGGYFSMYHIGIFIGHLNLLFISLKTCIFTSLL